MEAVTSILLHRRREAVGLRSMTGLSLGAHVSFIAALVFMPEEWRLKQPHENPRNVMTIVLGGAPGPRSGGMTPMGGRPIQTTSPAPDTRPRAITPPAPAKPEMTVPNAKSKTSAKAPVKAAPDEAKGRTPSRGAEVQTGSAIAETGVRGRGFGLSTGGGGTGGYLDVGDFCCPAYLETMTQLITSNWSSKQGVAAATQITFTIQRDGSLTNIEVEQPSGYAALDLMAQRAVTLTKQLPPLPSQFTEPRLTVHLRFEYQR